MIYHFTHTIARTESIDFSLDLPPGLSKEQLAAAGRQKLDQFNTAEYSPGDVNWELLNELAVVGEGVALVINLNQME